jgi:hypothetical protein
MQKSLLLLSAAMLLSACAGRYGNDEPSYQQCVSLARQEGQVIKYIDTTLQYRKKHHPGPEVEAELERARAERKEIHSERRALGCI